jgi:hypothetical protein
MRTLSSGDQENMSHVRPVSHEMARNQKGGFNMTRKELSFLLSLVSVFFWTDCCGGESRFFRISCLEGSAPENLAIVSDKLGQIFLEFDSQDLDSYVIESTDSLGPPPEWTTVCSVIGDGQRIRWLATWQPIEWVSLTGEEEAPPSIELPVANQSELGVSISLAGLTKQKLVEEGELWDLVRVPGCSLTDEVGFPQLPVLAKYISIPPGSTATLQIDGYEELTFSGFNVYPVQEPPIDKENARQPNFAKNERFYRTGSRYPDVVAVLDTAAVIRGHDIVMVRVYPASFDPASGSLIVRKTINLDVSFSSPDPDVKESRLRVRSEVFDEFVSGLTLNFASAEADEGTLKTDEEHPLQDEGAEVLIIAHPDLADAADMLARWKMKLGYSTMVVETTDINENGPTADDIETYIEDGYADWTIKPDFLILIGDADLVPTHYETEHPGAGPNPGDDYPDGTEIGTDLYYVTVDGTDYFPDIACGRIPVDNLEEATQVIRKIIEYERQPPPASAFYSTAAVAAYFQDSDPWNGYEDRRFVLTSEEVRDGLLTQGYTVSRLYNTRSYVSPTHYNSGSYDSGLAIPNALLRTSGFGWNAAATDVVDAVDGGTFAILYRDHGSSSNPSGTDDGWSHPEFENANVASLTNYRQLPVIFSIACETGWFDGETDDFANRNTECLCETLLRHRGGGAVGVIGSTRISYSGHNDQMEKGFCDAIWPNFLAYGGETGNQPMGQVLNYGKTYYATQYTTDTTTRKAQFEMYHYFGDPTMRMWAAAPQGMSVSHPATYGDNTESLTVTVSEDDATVTLIREDELLGLGESASGEVTFDFSPALSATAPIEVTVSKPGFRPYEGLINLPSAYRWSTSFGGNGLEWGFSVDQTSDGGYVAAGWTNSSGAGGHDMYLVKTDAYGNKSWDQTYGGDGNDWAYFVRQTADGGYLLAGYTEDWSSGAGRDAWAMKTDEDGVTSWEHTFGAGTWAEARWAAETPDGGYIIGGASDASGATDLYLTKRHTDPNKQWYRTYGAAPYSYAFEETADGGYIIATVSSNDVQLRKVNPQGDTVGFNDVALPGDQLPACIRQTSDGGFIVTGQTSTDAAGWDVFLMKADSECDEAWTVTFGGSQDDCGYSVEETTDGGYIIAGETRSFGSVLGVYLIKTKENGDEDWSEVIGEGSSFAEIGYSVQQTPDGGYVIAGYTENLGAGVSDLYLAKTDRDGNTRAP